MKLLVILTLLLATSCHKRSLDSASMFSKSGDLKDKIALVPMIDSSQSKLEWSITDELSSYLAQDLARKDTLYVVPCNTLELNCFKNPFSQKLDWLEPNFAHTQYVAFTELLKYQSSKTSAVAMTATIEMSVRVRVFEKTAEGFKPILQEIVQDSYLVPALGSQSLSLEPAPNTPLSPLSIAHQNFSKLVAKRIRDYIK